MDIPEGDHDGRFRSGKHADGNGTTEDLDNGAIPDGEMSFDKDILTTREPSKIPGKPERVDHEKEWPPPNGLRNACTYSRVRNLHTRRSRVYTRKDCCSSAVPRIVCGSPPPPPPGEYSLIMG